MRDKFSIDNVTLGETTHGERRFVCADQMQSAPLHRPALGAVSYRRGCLCYRCVSHLRLHNVQAISYEAASVEFVMIFPESSKIRGSDSNYLICSPGKVLYTY